MSYPRQSLIKMYGWLNFSFSNKRFSGSESIKGRVLDKVRSPYAIALLACVLSETICERLINSSSPRLLVIRCHVILRVLSSKVA